MAGSEPHGRCQRSPGATAITNERPQPPGLHFLISLIHHIFPLHKLGEDYQIDPVMELVPLCPNCHAMVHRGNDARPLSVAALRDIMEHAPSNRIAPVVVQ